MKAIVTGAASGIGRATARRLAEVGYAVVAVDRDPSGAALVEELAARGCRAVFVAADVSDADAVERIYAEVDRLPEPLTALVNVAGVVRFREPQDIPVAEWDEILAINLRSVHLMAVPAFHRMRPQGRGAIVNFASVHARATTAIVASYAAAKAGITALTRAQAVAWGPYGIRVNAVLPGPIDTPLMRSNLRAVGDEEEELRKVAASLPLRRVGTPEEVADVVAFLCSDQARFMTGSEVVVDGGMLATI